MRYPYVFLKLLLFLFMSSWDKACLIRQLITFFKEIFVNLLFVKRLIFNGIRA